MATLMFKLSSFFYPYITITFPEYTGNRLRRSAAFTAVQSYLASRSSAAAKRLKAEALQDTKALVLTIDDNEEMIDHYNSVKIWWVSGKYAAETQSFSVYPNADERRFFKLTFHRRHRELITGSYISHVMEEGKAMEIKNRPLKLFMNNNSGSGGGWMGCWRHVPLKHPSSFRTLAMDPKKKQEIVSDLEKFKNGKEYYEKVGKAWKRGYLLYGPPGTGKSTMIAAMANFLEYDVYDLELTSVKDNTELKKLLIEISSKSIIVIEDIDCSLDLTRERKKTTTTTTDYYYYQPYEEGNEKKVTLSGLLNFIDGIWSACGGERLIVFTTNHVEKLDPALVRRGRMDKHIEMSYCGFEAFKVLAMNYLDVEWHELYGEIQRLLEETEMTPADVAENLMPKSEEEGAEDCFVRLIEALESAKEEAEKKKKAEEEKNAEEKEKEAENLRATADYYI